MGFRIPKKIKDLQREREEKKYIDYKGEEIHVSELEDVSVTVEMHHEMRMNSYAKDDIPPKLTDEALIDMVQNARNNCMRPTYPCSTYEETLVHVLVPELIKRLENK